MRGVPWGHLVRVPPGRSRSLSKQRQGLTTLLRTRVTPRAIAAQAQRDTIGTVMVTSW